tara:strand:+ start:2074 stop:2448 length:375 start_codon:yes stop_codon:yes gene_type:complete
MATTTLDNSYTTYKVVVEDDLGSSTIQNITNGAGIVYSIFVDNTANTNDVSVLKVYDNLVDGGIDVDATEVDYQFTIAGGTRRLLSFPTGLTIANGLSLRCVTGGALANTSDPSQNVIVTVVYQ